MKTVDAIGEENRHRKKNQKQEIRKMHKKTRLEIWSWKKKLKEMEHMKEIERENGKILVEIHQLRRKNYSFKIQKNWRKKEEISQCRPCLDLDRFSSSSLWWWSWKSKVSIILKIDPISRLRVLLMLSYLFFISFS